MKNTAGIFARIALLCCISGLWGCPRQPGGAAAATDSVRQGFTLPRIPQNLTSPEDRIDYLTAHYWDNFDFTDTTLISKPEITEQAFADFIDLLANVSYPAAGSALTRMMKASAADSAMLAHFAELSEKYLYDPNSPLRDEELYIPVLRYLAASPHLDSLSRLRPRCQLELALRNRPGDIAADFTYTLKSGRRNRMSQIKADYTILFFNNPDCGDCNRVKEYMDTSPVIGGQLRKQAGQGKTAAGGPIGGPSDSSADRSAGGSRGDSAVSSVGGSADNSAGGPASGSADGSASESADGSADGSAGSSANGSAGRELAVLALYTEGDIVHWRNAEYPSGMINAYDAGQKIAERQSYDLKAMPTLYLLDKDKRVILKDAPVEQIEQWLVEKRKSQTQ